MSKEKRGRRTYLNLKCEVHGEFRLRADTLKDTGCKKCRRDKTKEKYNNQWKEDCSKIHNNKYDYTDTEVGNVLK